MISVVIPAKNEQHNIAAMIRSVRPYADEIVVIDGHSTDATREVSETEGAKVFLDEGKGKGSGIRKAIEVVTGDVIVFIDADGSHDANDIPALVKPIVEDRADLVVASRMTGGSDELHWALTAMFDAMTALSSKYNDKPETASRPYDKTRDGFAVSYTHLTLPTKA